MTRIAGNGAYGFSGDGGPATEAMLYGANDVAFDGAGDLYIVDSMNYRIRKVDAATGVISTVAGNGLYSSALCADGELATGPCVYITEWMTADAAGNLYFSDHNNWRVFRVDAATGTIRRFAGVPGYAESSGDGGPAAVAGLAFPSGLAVSPAGEVTIFDAYRLRRVDASGIIWTWAGDVRAYEKQGFYGEGVPATSAGLDTPGGIAFDGAGNLFVADSANNRIRRVDATSGLITTVAGAGEPTHTGDGGPARAANLYVPRSVTVDGAGNLYVAERTYYIRKIDHEGIIRTVAGNGADDYCGDGGLAVNACVSFPTDIVADAAGNLFFPDYLHGVVRKIDAATGIITRIAGTGTSGYSGDGGPATAAMLAYPAGLAVDSAGSVLIADRGNCRIRKVTSEGTITTVAGGVCGSWGDGGPALQAALNNPEDVAVDAAGALYIADTGGNRIRRVEPATGIIATYAGGGNQQAGLGDGGPALTANFFSPASVAVAPNGAVYVSDRDSHRIREVYALEASFTVAPDRGYRDDEFAFQASSNVPGSTNAWAFGDGTSAEGAVVSKVYGTPGVYTVRLTTSVPGAPDVVTITREELVCAGYVFSSSPETATTAPFTRVYALGGRLYARVWARASDVDFARVKSATLTLSVGRRSASAALLHEGNGVFSGSVPVDPKVVATGMGAATFTITDRAGRTFTATEGVIVE